MSDDEVSTDGLAAEYVLGAMTPDERRAMAARRGTDVALSNAITAWEHRLAPLSLREPGLEPPAGALQRTMAAIAQASRREAPSSVVVPLQRQLRRWRAATFAMAASLAGLAILLGGTLLAPGRQVGEPTRLAVLGSNGANPLADETSTALAPVFLVSSEPHTGKLTLRQVSGRQPAPGRVYALWLDSAGQGANRYVGALSRDAKTATFTVPGGDFGIPGAGRMIVTLEQEGLGASIRGPVVAAGTFETSSP